MAHHPDGALALPFIKSTAHGFDQTLIIRSMFIDEQSSRKSTLEALLQGDTDVWIVDAYRRNVLMWACLFRRDCEVALLLPHATSIDLLQADIYGNTALHLAVISGSAASVKLIKDSLIKHELSIDMENNCGITPKMEALRLSHDICYNLLLSEEKENTPVYKHQKRHTTTSNDSNGSTSALPPILASDLKRKLTSLDMKACYQLTEDNPSDFLRQACSNKSSRQKTSKGQPQTLRLPDIGASSKQRPSFSANVLSRRARNSRDHRLPDVYRSCDQMCNN